MNKSKIKKQRIERRRKRIRAKASGTSSIPRLSVYRSNKYIYAQLIDDSLKNTIVSMSSAKVKGKTFVERSRETGKQLAKAAEAKKINKIVFDRGGFKYAGRVKALAEGAREGGLEF
ncbi:MAG: 50S ribosomal protein L18 [Patescibacteria group bacterium]|nr:50S ribosomal protein L18 [Patescibacteria group bacterium]MDE1988375.1 50S ribosomal protein L18 [Patescibacteria group bacterium]MDE2218083.1 50S ribosomal protein L18 [Patescibacteria group bacterium]